ncbi:23208_t:CDS:2, partial [Dentiscutata erythropus]
CLKYTTTGDLPPCAKVGGAFIHDPTLVNETEVKINLLVFQRCADLDREIPILLSVSRAVLDNVIFCHQEKSTWPLSEPTPLKICFDEIFAATRWTKAIANITELQKTE